MTYTDEQYKRVAEWLGLKFQCGRFSLHDLAIHDRSGYVVREYNLNDWLISPEGRCAIEDKFIELGLYRYCFKDHKGMYWIKESIAGISCCYGGGSTPAAAWFDSAVRITEDTE